MIWINMSINKYKTKLAEKTVILYNINSELNYIIRRCYSKFRIKMDNVFVNKLTNWLRTLVVPVMIQIIDIRQIWIRAVYSKKNIVISNFCLFLLFIFGLHKETKQNENKNKQNRMWNEWWKAMTVIILWLTA